MPLESLPPDEPLPLGKAFRNLLLFQLKLAADALRDLLFSPISLIAFIIDALTRPTVNESLSLRLKYAGRRTDRVINLFDEHTSSGDYTIDATVAELEAVVQRKIKKRKD